MTELTDQLLKKIFWSIAALVFIYMLLSVPAYGISGDEYTQWKYGTYVWNYLKTFGEDNAIFTDPYIHDKRLEYYGGFLDGSAAMLIDIFKPKDEFLLRHYWCMLFGFLGILATGLLGKEMGGWKVGILAMIFLFFTGRYFGESFNNPKDPPFAATYVLAIYVMMRWLKRLSDPKWISTILLGLAIGLCISVRIGGLLLFAYLGLFYALLVWKNKLYKEKIFSKTVVHAAVAVAIGYIVSILWWPFALEAPLSNPLESLKVMSEYPSFIRLLFEGQRIYIANVPLHYMPKWFMIALPLFLLIGFIGGIAAFFKIMKANRQPFIWMVIFTSVFPIAYILYKHSVLYDGLRHSLFIIPSMAVTAALFYVHVYKILKNKSMKYAFAGLVLVLVALPARFMFANHPNEYVYFNELTGGIKGAYGEYETDYYMNSIKQGFEWLKKNELNKWPDKKDTVVIATNCVEPFFSYMQFSPVPVKLIYSRFYQKNDQDWDYAVYYGRFLDKEQLQNGYFPSELSIHNVTADGVPLSAVLKNDPERLGFKGSQAVKAGDTTNAVRYLSAATQKYPKDMELWTKLALVYMSMNNAQAANAAMAKAREISTLDAQTEMTAGEVALRSNDLNTASQIYGGMMENYPDMGDGYIGLAKVQAVQGNFELAIANVNTANEMAVAKQDGQLMKQGYMTLAFIYQRKGDMATAQRYYEEAQKIQ